MQKSNIINFKNIVFLILALLLVYITFASIEILIMMFAAFVIVCAINPLIDKMSILIPRGLSVALVILTGLLLVCFVIIPLISICINEAVEFALNFQISFDELADIFNYKIFNKSLSEFIKFQAVKDSMANAVDVIVQNAIVAGKSVANFITMVLAIAIMSFYYLYDEQRIKDKIIEFFPSKHKKTAKKIMTDIESKVGGYVVAQALAMIFVGIFIASGLTLIGNEHAILFGFITCIFDIIPVIGPVMAGILIVLSAIPGGIGSVLLSLLIIVVIQWAENQFIRPILFGRFLNMHPLMIIVSLLVCAKILGFWGIILAPAIASVICVLVDELYLRRINKA